MSSDTGNLAGTGAAYSASYSYDSMNRLTSSPLGSYTFGDSAHADAATAVGSTWTASYDAAGNLTCQAATSAIAVGDTQAMAHNCGNQLQAAAGRVNNAVRNHLQTSDLEIA